MASYTFCWVDKQTSKANCRTVKAKTKDDAIVEFAKTLETLYGEDVEGLCFQTPDYAYKWVLDNFPTWVCWNIIEERDLQRQEISFQVDSTPLL